MKEYLEERVNQLNNALYDLDKATNIENIEDIFNDYSLENNEKITIKEFFNDEDYYNSNSKEDKFQWEVKRFRNKLIDLINEYEDVL
jgi:hypothetical protein